MHRVQIGRLVAKGADDFARCADAVERRQGQDLDVFDALDAGVGVFLESPGSDAAGWNSIPLPRPIRGKDAIAKAANSACAVLVDSFKVAGTRTRHLIANRCCSHLGRQFPAQPVGFYGIEDDVGVDAAGDGGLHPKTGQTRCALPRS